MLVPHPVQFHQTKPFELHYFQFLIKIYRLLSRSGPNKSGDGFQKFYFTKYLVHSTCRYGLSAVRPGRPGPPETIVFTALDAHTIKKDNPSDFLVHLTLYEPKLHKTQRETTRERDLPPD
jgi:hypothetical protein